MRKTTYASSAALLLLAACVYPPDAENAAATRDDDIIIIDPGTIFPCITIQRGSTSGDIEDTQLMPGTYYGSSNFGANERITATGFLTTPGSNTRSLMKFNINPGALPAGATIRSAELFLRPIEDPGQGKINIYRATANWSEYTVTYNSFGNAYATPAIRTPNFDGLYTTRVDLTQQVIDWVSGAVPNYGILIGPDTDPLNNYGFTWSVGSSESEKPPYLKICYQPSVCAGQANGTACSDNDRCIANGTCQSGVCQGGQPAAAGTVCRPAWGVCDVAETCDGVNKACPAAAIDPPGTTCRAAAGPCDAVEVCDGSSQACPHDVFTTGNLCRSAAANCDVAEYCDGSGAACPADGFKAAGTSCRSANGACDVAESCTGTSAYCPADGYKAAGTSCRAANGACDVAENCTGASPACPNDGYKAAGTQCRGVAGPCDVAESCTGSGPSCPADGFVAAGTVCGSAGANATCDPVDTCTGGSASCPDSLASNGTSCGSGVVCQAGSCVACGNVGNPCCGGSCNGTNVCVGGTCQACGNNGGPCCGGTSCNSTSSVCLSGTCQACGGSYQPACAGGVCNAGYVAINGTCQACGAEGQPCCHLDVNPPYGCNGSRSCTNQYGGGYRCICDTSIYTMGCG